jgi:AcrR family transcriptional regulator
MVTNQDIKDTAFILFARNGYAETSMGAIADSLNLKKQSLYSHFESKAKIFSEVLRDQSIIMMGEIGGVIEELSDKPAEVFLKGVFESYVRIFSDRDRLLLWKRIIPMIGNEEYGDLVNDIFSQFSSGLSMVLYANLQMKYPSLDQCHFDRFFLSYMITIFGYLECMLLNDTSYFPFAVVWNIFWNGAANLLKAEAEPQEAL